MLRIRSLFDPRVGDPGWVKKSGSGMNNPDHISKSLETIFGFKSVLRTVLRIRIRDRVIFDPWIRDPGSGIGFFRIPDPKTIFLRAF